MGRDIVCSSSASCVCDAISIAKSIYDPFIALHVLVIVTRKVMSTVGGYRRGISFT